MNLHLRLGSVSMLFRVRRSWTPFPLQAFGELELQEGFNKHKAVQEFQWLLFWTRGAPIPTKFDLHIHEIIYVFFHVLNLKRGKPVMNSDSIGLAMNTTTYCAWGIATGTSHEAWVWWKLCESSSPPFDSPERSSKQTKTTRTPSTRWTKYLHITAWNSSGQNHQ